jgi:DNA-binding CsgD family transcriptional regulator
MVRRAATPLLERDRETAVLTEALERAIGGAGSLVLVEGPAGIGKTALVEQARAEADHADVTALVGTGSELERDFPYGVVRQLFEAPLRERSETELERALSGAAALAAPIVAPQTGVVLTMSGDTSFAVLHGLYWLTVNLTESGPLALLVDDFHWADLPSQRFLLHLARRLEGLPVLVVVSLRSDEADAEGRMTGELRSSVGAAALRPDPLSVAGVARVAQAALGEAPDERFARACHAATGGTPFLVRELVSALAAQEVRPTAEAADGVTDLGPETVGHAVLLRLARLPTGSVALAEAVATLGAEANLHAAAGLAQLDDAAAGAALDALVATGILRHGRPLDFVHPIVRAAVYRDMAPGRRSELHASAAELLETGGAEPDAVAAQILPVEPGGRAQFVATLRSAAAGALARGAADSAAAYLRRALDEGAGDRATLLRELGIAARAMRWPDAIEYLEQAHQLMPDGDARREVGLDLAVTLVYANRWADAIRLLEPEMDRRDGVESAVSVRAHAYWAAAAAFDPRLAAEFDRRLPELQSIASRGTAPGRSLTLLLANVQSLRGEAVEAVPRMVEDGLDEGRFLVEESSEAWALAQAGWALVGVDELDTLARLADDMLADANQRASVAGQVIGVILRGWVHSRRGDLVAAETNTRTGLDLALEYGLSFALPSILYYMAEPVLERPTLEDAGTFAIELSLPADLDATVSGAFIAEVRGRLRLDRGDRAGALEDLRHCGEIREALGYSNPNESAWRSHLARALAPSDHAEALQLARSELEDAERVGLARAVGVARHTFGLLDDGVGALDHLAAAVETLKRSPARLEEAHALVDLGAAMRRGNERVAAREPLRAGLDLAEDCGAPRLAQRARAELAATGARPRRARLRGAEALTPSERRIAEMAADGMSNPEIAQALFITRNTVQTHMRHVFEKLAVRSRGELRAKLEERTEAAG